MHQLCPACQGGHTHQCKYSGMHAHTHLGETTPMCKSKPGQLQLPSAPPAPCPLHANAPGEELCHGNPQPRSQGPQSRATGHAEPGVCLGNSTTQHRQQYPAVPHAMPALVPVVPALALTCKSGCLMPLALPVVRSSSPLGANPSCQRVIPQVTQPQGISPLKGFTASQCPWAGRAGAVTAAGKVAGGQASQGIRQPRGAGTGRRKRRRHGRISQPCSADSISTRLCPHRDTRAATGAHGQRVWLCSELLIMFCLIPA